MCNEVAIPASQFETTLSLDGFSCLNCFKTFQASKLSFNSHLQWGISVSYTVRGTKRAERESGIKYNWPYS